MNATKAMSTEHPLTREEIESFAREWYRKLDEHVAAAEIVSMISDRDLAFHLPEGVLTTRDAVREWYEGGPSMTGVINIFFDEVHTVRRVAASWSGERAVIEVVVNWQGRRWARPAARSQWFGFDAYQEWEMSRSPETGAPVINRYVVNELRPMPGSPAL